MADKTNKYHQLVADMQNGNLPLTIVLSAIRQYYRERKDIPDGIKDLLCGTTNDSGYIHRQFQVMRDAIGKMELAYRRGAD